MTKARIYTGEKIGFSINGVEKTGQLNAKESNWNTFYMIGKNKLKID